MKLLEKYRHSPISVKMRCVDIKNDFTTNRLQIFRSVRQLMMNEVFDNKFGINWITKSIVWTLILKTNTPKYVYKIIKK